MLEPRRIPPEERLGKKWRWVVVIMNLLLLAELTLSIYRGQQGPEHLAGIFLRAFVPSAAATVVLARVFMRRFQAGQAK
jgi:hypothetical protein